MKKLAAFALLLAGCASPVLIEPAHDYATSIPRQGQFAPGYCVEHTAETTSPPASEAMALCERLYGDVMQPIGPMECWQSHVAAAWGCVPVCGQQIVAVGAEQYPSDLWCCPW